VNVLRMINRRNHRQFIAGEVPKSSGTTLHGKVLGQWADAAAAATKFWAGPAGGAYALSARPAMMRS